MYDLPTYIVYQVYYSGPEQDIYYDTFESEKDAQAIVDKLNKQADDHYYDIRYVEVYKADHKPSKLHVQSRQQHNFYMH